jgi:trans-aconitate 2-methyltransferase
MMSWSAKQYLAFEDQRTRPVRDLLAAVPAMSDGSVLLPFPRLFIVAMR